MTPVRRYTSGRDRLLRLGELGPFFQGAHAMQLFGWDSKTAAHYMWLWGNQGLVRSLGGKSDVFFNLVADHRATDHLEQAIRRAMPGAVVGARSVLHAAGVTTQRPGMLDILVRPDERVVSIDEDLATVEPRSLRWWTAIDMTRSIDPGDEERLARLRPGAAIADSALSRILAPDDLDFDEVRGAERKRALGLLALLAGHGKRAISLVDAYRQAWEAGVQPAARRRRATLPR